MLRLGEHGELSTASKAKNFLFVSVGALNGEWLITGTSGVILIVTGFGVSVKRAQAQAYQRVKNILIPNMYYRTDIGDRWFEDHDKLHSWGYLRES